MSVICGAEVVRPADLAAALRALADRPELRPLAGGTDLMVGVEAGVDVPEAVLDLWALEELRGVCVEDGVVVLGALTTYAEIMRRTEVTDHFPALVEASAEVGAVQIQNRGTLGGNIVNASPAGDTLPPLLVYGAELELVSVRGRRRVAFDGFYSGYKQMDRAPDELLAAVRLPVPPSSAVHWWRKVGTRRAQSISKVMGAGFADVDTDGALRGVRVALGSVAATPVRLRRTEALIEGRRPDVAMVEEVRACVVDEVTPIDDVRSTADYRKAVSGNIVARWIRDLAS